MIYYDLQSDPEVSIKGAQEVMESDGESSALPSLSNDVNDLMEIDNDGTNDGNESTANSIVTLVSASTQTQTNLRVDRTSSNLTLQNYAKLIKPVLSASSRLGRALAELFGLLVKVSIRGIMI